MKVDIHPCDSVKQCLSKTVYEQNKKRKKEIFTSRFMMAKSLSDIIDNGFGEQTTVLLAAIRLLKRKL